MGWLAIAVTAVFVSICVIAVVGAIYLAAKYNGH